MLFNSYAFVFAFLPTVLVGWWALKNKSARLIFLCLASYAFYGFWDYRFVPLMLLSSSADYFAGRAIHASDSPRVRRTWLVALLIFNLGLLASFKYYDFFASSLNSTVSTFGGKPVLPLFHIILPIGISFYTFNSISYTIDIYRRRIEPAKNLLEFSTFVAMFPHLIAGPIVRYSDMGDQFARLRKRIGSGDVNLALWFFVAGLVKKVLIADPIAKVFVTPLFAEVGQLKLVGAWVATFAYTLQIYFDFSGYSDMAVGLALALGLYFPQNFNSPYKSENISEFWRRWHISLSSWLRDYLFIPLGGSRNGNFATMRNLAITMFLGGLWHGASWTFVAWGLYHGALLAIHTVLRRFSLTPRSRPLSVAVTFLAVMVGWVFFRASTLHEAFVILGAMVGRHGIESRAVIAALLGPKPTLVLAVAGGIALFAPNTWQFRVPRVAIAGIALAAALVIAVLRFAHPSPFLYFQF